MKKQVRVSFFILAALFSLVANLVFPTSVFADDETPTPASEETSLPSDEIPVDSSDLETETSPQDSTGEPAPVSEILNQLPENTELVVLDENGGALPLVTQQAEATIITGDPMWCPEGQLPGDAGCTPSFSDFDSGTGLLQYLVTNNTTYTGNGTIFVAYNYNPTTAGDGDVILSGTTLQGGGANANLGNLTLQGGWDFGNNSVNGQTNFGANYLNVTNWTGNVTINDIFVDGSSSTGISVTANGDIQLNNVTSNNNTTQSGAFLDNSSGSGNVSVSNSQFNNNGNTTDDHGLWVQSNGNVNLNNVTAHNNYYAGASLGNYTTNNFIGGNVFVSNSSFNDNGILSDWDGLDILANGDVEISNVTANQNGWAGFWVQSNGNVNLNNITAHSNDHAGATLGNYVDNNFIGGNVSVSNSSFNQNGIPTMWDGLDIYSNGDVEISNVIANQNGWAGFWIGYSANGTTNGGNVTIVNSTTNNNAEEGMYIDTDGGISLKNVTSNNNGADGAELYNHISGAVSIKNSQFSGNGDSGLNLFSVGNITLNNIFANGNSTNGVYLDNPASTGNIVVNGGQFNGNGNAGALLLNFSPTSKVTVINAYFNGNSIGGLGIWGGNIYLENITSTNQVSGAGLLAGVSITIKCSTFSNNFQDGMELVSPELNLYGVTFINNGVNIDDQTPGGSSINIFDYDCNPSTSNPNKSTGTTGTGLPLKITSGNSADLDCDNYSGTVLILPNEDKVTFKCPIKGSATLNSLTNDGLPNKLPAGMDYVSGLVATQSPDGSDVALDGLVVISFVIPDDMQGEDFAILYWDGNEWLDLDEATFDDGRKVLNGGYVTEDGYFEAFTNFSGNFVLVKK